jgi:short-subunit dehydrogenase
MAPVVITIGGNIGCGKSTVIVNVEGAGSENNETKGYAVYGATKSAITQFTQTLRREYPNNNVHVCLLSPGMMFTELLLCDDITPQMKLVFETYGEHPENVSECVVPQMLNVNQHETIKHLPWWKIILKTFVAILL